MVRELDVQGFLPKPFALDTLLDVLRDVLGQDSPDVLTAPTTP